MELMISRILKYLNGCLDDDHMYRIGNFIIKNYTLIENHTMVSFIDAGTQSRRTLGLLSTFWNT